jgi:hypothetical protein
MQPCVARESIERVRAIGRIDRPAFYVAVIAPEGAGIFNEPPGTVNLENSKVQSP